MKSLDELKDQQPQILLAELAGLLHNIGKLHGDFFDKFTGGSTKYNDQRSDDASQVVRFKAAKSLIEDSTKSRRDLITALLSDGAVWGSDATTAHLLETEWRKITRTSQQFKEIRKDLLAAAANVSSPNTGDIIEAVLGAYKLADLLQIPGLDQYLDQPVKDWLRNTNLKVLVENHNFSEMLLLYWDDFHIQPNTPNDQMRASRVERWIAHDTRLPRYLATTHGVVSAAEKEQVAESFKPQISATPFRSTVFGYEVDQITASILDVIRKQLLDTVMNADLLKSDWNQDIAKNSEERLSLALGDMRWPINDVTLWDFASSISTFFKAAVAKALIEDRFVETSDLQWRLLSIRYDGLEYLSRAHHISDLLARRDTIEAALVAVKTVIEVEYPLGNEIYRDENGSVLLVPDVREGEQRIELLAQECGEVGTLDDLLLKRFSETSYGEEEDQRSPLGGEIKPIIALSDERLGKQIKLTEAKGWSHPPLQADPGKVQSWWSDPKKCGEVCAVCGLRPQGFGAPDDKPLKTGKKGWELHLEEKHHEHKKQPLECEVCKAIDRQVCWVCLERRDDRSKKWMNNADGSLKRTIWTDEVADSNGRLALVVGRFVLDGWLDGALIPTMQKSASFARIQRCWRTTQEFWQEVEKKLPELVGEDSGSRLKLTPENRLQDKLGPSHVYDLELNGRHLSVVWTGERFITADNLEYFGQTAGLGKEPDWETLLEGKSFHVYESSARLGHRDNKAQVIIKKGGVAHGERYSPFIPILARPALFMALVPANKAMEVAKHVQCKYETEMGRVRDRLPLHLGLIIAPRRTPVRALLEAGRRMLEIPDVWEDWEVESVSHNTRHHITFKNNGVKWHIPAMMGDGATPDQWYSHLMLRKPVKGEDLTTATPSPWKHAKDLQPGDKVYVRPSRFDFEFLDTTGRRFELNYDEAGVRVAPANRLHPSTRPFLLEEIADLETVWDALKKLPAGQRDFLARLIETKRTEWKVTTADDPVLRRFACDTLKQTGAEQKWWTDKLDDEQRRLLEEWATNGRLADAVELYEKMMKLET